MIPSQARATVVLWVQGVYFLLTGVWPLLHYPSFEWVTGPKTDHIKTGQIVDHWLVYTVAALITCISLALIFAAWRRSPPLEIVLLAVSSSIALMLVDFIYVARDVIRPVYLIDAVAQILLLLAWLWCAAGVMRTRVRRRQLE
jgi:hypothetical protein